MSLAIKKPAHKRYMHSFILLNDGDYLMRTEDLMEVLPFEAFTAAFELWLFHEHHLLRLE